MLRNASRVATTLLASMLAIAGIGIGSHPLFAAYAESPADVAASGYLDLTMSGQASVTRQEETQVGPGIMLTEFERLEPRGWQQGAVLDVDLTNPEVSLDYLDSGIVADTATLVEMTQVTDDIKAAVNGDGFDINNSGAANGVGVDPSEGIVKSSVPGRPILSLVMDHNKIASITDATLKGSVSAQDWTTPISSVNTQGLASDAVTVYTSRWGEYQRGSGTLQKYPDALEVWLDSDHRVVKTAQKLGQEAIPAGQTVVAAGQGEIRDHLASLALGDVVNVEYQVVTSDNEEPLFAIGAFHPLVRAGQNVATDKSVHPRTGAGINTDGTRLILAVIDGRSSNSRGMTLPEFADFFLQLGASDAINLDGGGSSTMVVNDPGDQDVTVVNTPSDGSLRADGNGLGVGVKKGSGQLTGYAVSPLFQANGAKRLFPGFHRQLVAKGFDENSWSVDQPVQEWTSSDPAIATVDADGLVTAVAAGSVTITATNGNASGSVELKVLNEMDRLLITPNTLSIPDPNVTRYANVMGYDSFGFGAPIEVADITASGATGLVDITAGKNASLALHPLVESGAGTLTIQAGDFSQQLAVMVGTSRMKITSMEGADQYTNYGARTTTSSIAVSTEGHTGEDDITAGIKDTEAIALTNGFNKQGGTRTNNIKPNAAAEHYVLPQGNVIEVGAWFKDDGTPGNQPMVYFAVSDANDQWNWLYAQPRISGNDWQYISVPVPQDMAMPVQVQRVATYETVGSKQYVSTTLIDDIEAVVAPFATAPEVSVYQDPSVDQAGSTDSSPLRVAIISDAQFVSENPNSSLVQAARRVLRDVVAQRPDQILIVGDFTDEGEQGDMELAKQILDEELAGTNIPYTYVPGNHEAMKADDLAPFKAVFGDTYTAQTVKNTRIVTLDSHPYNLSHDAAQIKWFEQQLNDVITDQDTTGLILALHHPTRDNLTNASALNDPQDAALIEHWTAKVRDAGKSVLVVNAGVGAFDVYQVDGVVHVTNGNAGKGPHSTPDRGGFTGWTMLGINPDQGLWRDSAGEWLNLEIRPFVDELTIEGPTQLTQDDPIKLTGTIVQHEGDSQRDVPAAWPVSFLWSSASPLVYEGDPSAAPAHAAAALDSSTGELVGLERVLVDGQIVVPDENTRVVNEGDGVKTESRDVPVTLTVNGTSKSYQVSVVLPVAERVEPVLTPSVSAESAQIERGEMQAFKASGFQPNEQLSFIVHSEPIEVATVTSDAEGNAAVQWRVPADFQVGPHTVEVTGVASESTASSQFEVVSASLPDPDSPGDPDKPSHPDTPGTPDGNGNSSGTPSDTNADQDGTPGAGQTSASDPTGRITSSHGSASGLAQTGAHTASLLMLSSLFALLAMGVSANRRRHADR
ncbi:phosphodiester glycosidase family protein [Actinomyces sp. HMSC065F12]|uniref:phosphodiester glycosidase family protein n=1 Tax=Actinomyces sp. HMSC065F12 TaxID=1739479 RepID=UPI0008A5DEA1|nr:phosphodiester glycosidase family protein [Actinomyces sp. HMSC065F12]OFP68865.1 hypothetical protein HMPREF2975_00485 [Actinomyces sp. HMSC065F12]